MVKIIEYSAKKGSYITSLVTDQTTTDQTTTDQTTTDQTTTGKKYYLMQLYSGSLTLSFLRTGLPALSDSL